MKTAVIKTFPNGVEKYEAGILICECSDPDHSLIYQKWDEEDKTKREVFLRYCLDPDRSFWRRLTAFWRYVIRKERYGTHGEIILTKRNISGFEDIIEFLKEE